MEQSKDKIPIVKTPGDILKKFLGEHIGYHSKVGWEQSRKLYDMGIKVCSSCGEGNVAENRYCVYCEEEIVCLVKPEKSG